MFKRIDHYHLDYTIISVLSEDLFVEDLVFVHLNLAHFAQENWLHGYGRNARNAAK